MAPSDSVLVQFPPGGKPGVESVRLRICCDPSLLGYNCSSRKPRHGCMTDPPPRLTDGRRHNPDHTLGQMTSKRASVL
ncbi:hypothetical protein TNCV_3683901 [Trichonephila clavipes]|nr:hypothetical protein TNCV_3683901 [Trichonephila clavipes]